MSEPDKYERVLDEPGVIERPDPNPPFKGNLTVIWEEEKRALNEKLNAHALVLEALATRVKTLENWAIQLRREPTAFTENRPGAGIGQGLPRRGKSGIPEVDYEGPTEN